MDTFDDRPTRPSRTIKHFQESKSKYCGDFSKTFTKTNKV